MNSTNVRVERRLDRLPRQGRAVFAGLADTALAAAATLLVGVVAARILSPPELGAYSIYFTAFALLGILPSNLVLIPIELELLKVDRIERTGFTSLRLRIGLIAGSLSACALPLVPLLVDRSAVSGSTLTALAATAAANVVLSPTQDHYRRVFHLAARSSYAAVTSGTQLAAAIAAWLTMSRIGVADPWIPFGSLGVANLVSLSVAVALSIHAHPTRGGVDTPWSARDLAGSGRWLAVQGIAPQVSAFIVPVLVGKLVSLAAVGQAEAARIVMRPITLITRGLGSALGPRAMEAGRAGDRGRALWVRRAFWFASIVLGLPYLAYTLTTWDLNIIRRLVPRAFDNVGLTGFYGLALLAQGLSISIRGEVLGLRLLNRLTVVDVGAALLSLGIASLAIPHIGAYSIPLLVLIASLLSFAGRLMIAESGFGARLTPDRPADDHPIPQFTEPRPNGDELHLSDPDARSVS